MKTITITVDVDGNEVSRSYKVFEIESDPFTWGTRVEDMLDTLEKSNESMKEIPGFEGTLEKLNEF